MNEIQKRNERNMRPAEAREMKTVEAQLLSAKKFPRDTVDAIEKIKNACTRPQLAEMAEYQYPRGGMTVTGPSIRLAETIAQCWGNIDFGMRELDRFDGDKNNSGWSLVEAYAWDIENNVKVKKTFTVNHVRDTRNGRQKLQSERDIYELAANQGARRLRSCLLAVVPGDVIETALKQIHETQKGEIECTPESRRKMVEAFQDIGVSKEDIEGFIGRRIDTLEEMPVMMLRLRRIYRSLKDEMSEKSDWFHDKNKKKPVDEDEDVTPGKDSDKKKTPNTSNKKSEDKKKKKPKTKKAPEQETMEMEPDF